MPVDPTSLLAADPSLWDSAAPQWQMVYADKDGANLGEVTEATDRTINFPLNQPSVVQYKLNTLHTNVPKVLQNALGMTKVYKRKQLQGVYETTSIQVSGEGTDRSVAVVATEVPWVRLKKRRIGRSADGVTYDSMQRGAIAQQIVDDENDRYDMGIRIGTIEATESATAGPWYYKRADEAIMELGSSLNGFDMWFEPHDPAEAPEGAHSYMNIAPVRGRERENALFEYGTGRANLRNYNWLIDVDNLIDVAYVLPSAYPDNAGLAVATAVDFGLAIDIGVREDVIETELTDEDLRQDLADEHLEIRQNPRNLYQFNPHYDDLSGRVPAFPFDYNVGDIVRARVNDAGVLQLDGQVRIYGVQVDLDTQGAEEITLTVVDESQ